MLVKGEVKEVLIMSNKLRVRIPVFESAGSSEQAIFTCTLCYSGIPLAEHRIGDIVYVEFENNNLNKGVVTGFLYTGPDEDMRKEETIIESDTGLFDNVHISGNLVVEGNVTTRTIKVTDYITPATGITFNPNGCKIFIMNDTIFVYLEFITAEAKTSGFQFGTVAEAYRPYPGAVYSYGGGQLSSGVKPFRIHHDGSAIYMSSATAGTRFVPGQSDIATVYTFYHLHN